MAESWRLITALGVVPDPRGRRGRRHGLQSVLHLVVGAVMAGKTSIVGIAGWAARADHQLVVCGPVPSAATFARVLAALDPVVLQTALDRWVAGRCQRRATARSGTGPVAGAGGRAVIAVDGKVVRGARTPTGQVKLVAAYEQSSGLVLGQVAVDGGDEIAALPKVLARSPAWPGRW